MESPPSNSLRATTIGHAELHALSTKVRAIDTCRSRFSDDSEDMQGLASSPGDAESQGLREIASQNRIRAGA